MGLYDVNLKKTPLGYQFDHNVYIGYQINDNRVVTVKELKGWSNSSGGGGGGGSGDSIDFELNGATITFTKNGSAHTYDIEQVKAEDVTGELPENATVCLLVPDAETGAYQIYSAPSTLLLREALTIHLPGEDVVYDGSAPISLTFSGISTASASTLSIVSEIGNDNNAIPNVGAIKQYAGKVSVTTVTTSSMSLGLIDTTAGVPTVATQLISSISVTNNNGQLVLGAAAEKVVGTLTLNVGATSYTFDGSANQAISFNTTAITAASSIGIASDSTQTPPDSYIPTIGYIKNSGMGGNVYSTENTPDGTKTSDGDSKFIFVEVNSNGSNS